MLLKIIFSAALVLILGGFAYFAFMDVPVHQTDKVETLTAESF